MKQRIFSAISAVVLLGAITSVTFSPLALADDHGKEHPEHSITDAHEGIEGGELLAAGGGIVIAIGLAYAIGRRSGKKR
ncbi:unannotated protein [freshwater metagenome]|uniref:Unannotated protein n=1 Tax=freshwater metagenome TaxID=449393 RepID=A0A6J5Z598_9ZZZZ|nr:hypothetical protein [Actinomycetota bacterium]